MAVPYGGYINNLPPVWQAKLFNRTQLDGIKKSSQYRSKCRSIYLNRYHQALIQSVGRELFKLYCIFVRPILEANSVIFHPMLSAGDRGDLEKLQKRVVKLCFGFERSFADIVRTEDISSLEERRVRASKKFVAKALKNDRFGPRWFVPREDITTELRQRNKFHVNRARTTRYLNSPLVYMQRLANSLT